MPTTRFVATLKSTVEELNRSGVAKGHELVITEVLGPEPGRAPRVRLGDHGAKTFLRMNANSYLGLSLHPKVIRAEEEATRAFGAGPGAVRFISGTYAPHVALEKRLAAFHGRDACMLNSAAYSTVLGVIASLATEETIIVSDELNHNCIINAMKLARPKAKHVYRHRDMAHLEELVASAAGTCENVIIVTDGVFSMRGVYAPLHAIRDIAARYNERFARDVVVIVDDSHGVGAFGETGRGTEEVTSSGPVDILVATLGKALGVNGGYVVACREIIDFLRERNSFYIYTNPITPGEAGAAIAALDVLESTEGQRLLKHLAAMTTRFEVGLQRLGFETLPSPHPVVPLMVRNTARTRTLVGHLLEHGVLATGLSYPVVPRGDESIRFQVAADHQPEDIDYVLEVLAGFQAGV
ncbi:MAG: aminotransferase class I/II-fold pyridoxal phosphate-dependent enzyme [Candidatus Schekmanbacteria bacterium]|nr:aminotransferase class I/II-fold pyridoxal phosphate-dependent enzyme [Candidatus Schekmanbacteria bacterium]